MSYIYNTMMQFAIQNDRLISFYIAELLISVQVIINNVSNFNESIAILFRL